MHLFKYVGFVVLSAFDVWKYSAHFQIFIPFQRSM